MKDLYTAFIYTTKIKDTKHNTTFDKYHISYNGKNMELALWKECEAHLISDMKVQKLSMPLEIAFDNEQYYAKTITYNRNDGTSGKKTRIYLKDYMSVKQAEYKKKTLDDITSEPIDKE